MTQLKVELIPLCESVVVANKEDQILDKIHLASGCEWKAWRLLSAKIIHSPRVQFCRKVCCAKLEVPAIALPPTNSPVPVRNYSFGEESIREHLAGRLDLVPM